MEDNTPNTEATNTPPPVDEVNDMPEFLKRGQFDISTVIDPFHAENALLVQSMLPSLPDATSLNTNRQLQGDFSSGPTPGKKPANLSKGTADFAAALVNQMIDPSTVKDRYKYSKPYSFGSGQNDFNYDRYYSHPNFDKLGFSPTRDNESLYNENSTWWNDFSRMGSQFLPLVWSGAKSVWGNTADAQEEMDRRMAIGTTSKGGFGGWVTNFAINSAYTLGIMGELFVEDLAFTALEAATFGGATPLGAGVAAHNVMGFGKVAQAWSTTAKAIKALKTFDSARDFYLAAKVTDKAIDFGKWVNPFQRTLGAVDNLITGANGYKNMSNLAKTTRSLGSFYRDIRELNVAFSESKIEGWGAARDYESQLINDYYNKYGEMPDDAASKKIHDQAQSVWASATTANMGVIYLTNKLVFNKLFEGGGVKSLADTYAKVGRGMSRVGAAEFKAGEGLIKEGTKLSKYQRTADFLTKSAYVPWSRKYLMENLGEGIQESSQEIIHNGVLSYYENLKKDPGQSGFYGTIAAIGKGASDQFSAEGLNTFLSGYLMGGFIGMGSRPIMSSIDYAQSFINKTQTKADQQREADEKATNDITSAVNFAADNALLFGDTSVNLGVAVKQAHDNANAAAKRGDTNTEQDMKDEMQTNHFEMLARSGSVGIVQEHINDMLNLDDQHLTDAYGKDVKDAKDVREKLNNYQTRLSNYESNYKALKKKLPNPFDPNVFSKKDKDGKIIEQDAYTDEVYGYLAHEQMVSDILFSTETYKDLTQRMTELGDSLAGRKGPLQNLVNVIRGGTPVANAAGADVSLLIDPYQRGFEIDSLKQTISALRGGTFEQEREANLLQGKLDLLKEWNNVASNFITQLKSEDKAQFSPEEAQARTEHARMRTGATVEDKKGNSYKIYSSKGDKVTVKTKNGTMKTFNKKSLKVTKDVKGLDAKSMGAVGSDAVNDAIYNMYDVFDQYVRQIAKIKKGEVFDEDLNLAFTQLKNFMHTERDRGKMINTINRLSNPAVRNQYFNTLLNLQKIKRERDAALVEEGYQEFLKRMKQNQMLQDLFGIGVYVRPENIDALIDSFRVTEFYDATSKDKIPYNSEKYKEALDIVEKYAGEKDTIVRGRQIVEEKPEPDFDSRARSKFGKPGDSKVYNPKGETDLRTYNDLAQEYGFSPSASSSTVPTQDVLKSIIASKYTTAQEKALAQRLLTVVPEGTVITFVNNLEDPGVYRSGTKETVVDARYSSEDYAQGENSFPVEHVILHELLHSVTVESLSINPQFKNQIEDLLEIVRANAKGKPGLPLYGTKNAAEFVAEALTNDVFQRMLKSIPVASVSGKPSSAWDTFMDALREVFEKLFGSSAPATVLDEALYIITTNIDNFKGSGQKAQPTAPTPSSSTPRLDKIRNNPELIDKLIEAYKAESAKGVTLGDLPKESVDGTRDEILSAEDFRRYVEESVDAFNIINGVKTGPQPVESLTTPEKYRVGKKFLFTGTTTEDEELKGEPVEVTQDAGEEIDEDGERTHLLLLKNVDTGKQYTVDIHPANPAVAAFKTSPIPPKVQVATAPSQKLIDKALSLGFTEAHVVAMTNEQREIIRTATDKADVKDLLEKFTPAEPVDTLESKKADIERIEIPRYFTFNELGGAKGKSGKALSSVEADKNNEIAENFEKQLQEGDKLIEPNGTVTYFRNGKVVKSDGSPFGMVDIPAFINGVTIERNAKLAALEGTTLESEVKTSDLRNLSIALTGTDLVPANKELFGNMISPKEKLQWVERNTPLTTVSELLAAIKLASGETDPQFKMNDKIVTLLKIAYIEKRRQKSISEIGLAQQGSIGKYVGYYESPDGKETSGYADSEELIKERLNKKYDAELAALESTQPVNARVDIEKLKQTPEGKEIEKNRQKTIRSVKMVKDMLGAAVYEFDVRGKKDSVIGDQNTLYSYIDGIYDAELIALEGTAPVAPVVEETEDGSEPVVFSDLMDAYANITTKKELDDWKAQASLTLQSPSEKRELNSKHGIVLTGEVVRKMVEEKTAQLKESLKFEDLVPGTVVITKTNQTLVVKELTARDVILISEEDYRNDVPNPSKTTIDRNVIKEFITMVKDENMTVNTEPIVTPQETVESDKEVKNVGSEVDPALVDQAITSDNTSTRNDAAKDFKLCNSL